MVPSASFVQRYSRRDLAAGHADYCVSRKVAYACWYGPRWSSEPLSSEATAGAGRRTLQRVEQQQRSARSLRRGQENIETEQPQRSARVWRGRVSLGIPKYMKVFASFASGFLNIGKFLPPSRVVGGREG